MLGAPKSKTLSNRKVRLAFAAAIAIMLVVAGLSYRSSVAAVEVDRWVSHTHEVLDTLQDLALSMRTLESSARGFLLSGNDSYLESYRSGLRRLELDQAAVGALTVDNSNQQRQLPALARLIALKMQAAQTVMDLRRSQGLDAAVEAVRTGTGQRITFDFESLVGQLRSEELRLLAIRDADAKRSVSQTNIILILGTVLGLIITGGAGWTVQCDNSRRESAEEALFGEKERAEVTLNSIGDAVACTDISGHLTYLNPIAETMSGWTWQEAEGRPMPEVFRILDGTSRQAIPNPMAKAIAQNRHMHLPANSVLIRRDGFEIPIEDSVAPIHDRQGRPTGAVIAFRDVTAARSMALRMAHAAEHDFLTGLPNRMLLNDRIRQAIAVAPRHKKQVAVLFLDLDGFKHINDSLGHAIGDKLLQSIAKRLADCVRASDTVSRLGGDEFVVLLSEVRDLEEAAIAAGRMLEAVAKIHFIDRNEIEVTTSIGISVHPGDGPDAETLIKNADEAMYQAKDKGRQNYQFFQPTMNARAVERQSIEESLRRGLERRELALHYQPKIHLTTGAIIGAEALIRWTHPTRGSVSPAQFISIAEACGLMLPIGAWVLREACGQARAWADQGLPACSMTVNVCALEFLDETFADRLLAILGETGLDPKFLELDVTEKVLMRRPEATAPILQALRNSGVQVAIDDFGTGDFGLSHLRRFSVDAVKIDSSLVRQISAAGKDSEVVTAAIAMARGLKLRVVAEGVETAEALDFLRARHCDEAQGYYFSPPLPASQFAELLEAGIGRAISPGQPALLAG